MTRGLLLALAVLWALSAGCSGNQGGDDDDATGDSGENPLPDAGNAGQDGGSGNDAGGLAEDGGGGADASTGDRGVGDACELDDQCPAGGSGMTECLTDGFPGGYCSVVECEAHGHDCPDDAGLDGDEGTVKCVQIEVLQCMKLCTAQTDCRDGYDCVGVPDSAGHGTVDICLPAGGGKQSDAGMGGGGGGDGMEGADGGMMGGGGGGM